MLQTHNLSVHQGGAELWRSLNLSIGSAERLGIFAPSGYGKTTLGRVLAGWQRPSAGEVMLDGEPLPASGYCPVQLVPQHPERTFNPARTVGAALRDVWQPEEEWLEALSLHPRLLTRYPDEVSGGELARIALLRALAPQTRYLIADEITAQLDPFIQAKVWRFLLEISDRRPLAMVVISHSRALLRNVCSRVWEPDSRAAAR
ncbi:nickel ABC transporter ATP-binding protein [Leminorella grimontii]|uniref:Nickel ABC transporter ATP-binding protein n=1 Tax=Leminorella grimontii TaxID=82981 RepID=A0AAV5N4V8_9GAMM|nr:ATP-binding cassette domain-containing protein [Leminorella grimontii]KFC92913.1 ATP-binding component of an ABC superfamily nickel transporter [Leminorella grimontii ATCC 33999 = DSM 5078]GKX56797.1 nickel ABC transporter ATP-binding protein [Leminorella grimontii]VFS62321.1 Methionine import ATP-binding protein MetN 2 [Leminorella grimontii]